MGADDLLAVHDYSSGHRYYAAKDQLGSVRALTRRDGVWTAALKYRSYGALMSSAGTIPFRLRYRWIGREFDEETGFYYLRARYYDPASQRFTQEDPIGYAGGSNVYAYGDGNPTNGRDLNGLAKQVQAEGLGFNPFSAWVYECIVSSAGCYENDPYSSGLHAYARVLGEFELWLGRQHKISASTKYLLRQLYRNDQTFVNTMNRLLTSGRTYAVVAGNKLTVEECSSVRMSRDPRHGDCGHPASAYAPDTDLLAPPMFRVTPEMEAIVGQRITGGIVWIGTDQYLNDPAYSNNVAMLIWHEFTHLLGLLDGHGTIYLGHAHQVFCGVPGPVEVGCR